jgi:DNA-binding LacI/PurR family transcriptional regulator
VASALKSAGLTLRAGRCELAADGRVAWAQALLAAPDRPTAVLCYSTDDALPLLLAARTLGLAVPRDLSLVAVHDRPFTASGQDLTRLHLAFTEVGRIGVERLLARIAHPRTRLAPVAVPCPWYEGTTCAPPPSR